MGIVEIVALAVKGDSRAKSDLAARAAGLIYARVYRTLYDREAASDVAQDALLAALIGLPKLREPRAFIPWLRRITDNVIADHILATRNRTSHECHPTGSSADRDLVVAEERARVRSAIEKLPVRNRLAVELFYFQDLTSRQVADFLLISDDTARATLSRSRKMLERRLLTMTAAQQTQTRIRSSVKSGTDTFDGPVFGHDSDTAELYLALYPVGNAAEAADSTGLSGDQVSQELTRLRNLRLIAPRGDNWICTMPVVGETDREMIQLWVQPILEVITPRLDAIYSEASALAETVEGELARSTVLTVGLLEGITRPFSAIRRQMGSSAPDRGDFGSFCASVFTCERPGQVTLSGGLSCGHSAENDGDIYTYYYHPPETNRSGIRQFLRSYDLDGWPASGTPGNMERVLLQGVNDGLTPQIQQRATDALAIPKDRRDEFWQSLVDLHAVAPGDGHLLVTVPRLSLDDWVGFLARLEEIGQEVCETAADSADDLRKRAARCSFADCHFADSVMAFFSHLEGMVKEAVVAEHPIEMPKEADFSWGVLIAA